MKNIIILITIVLTSSFLTAQNDIDIKPNNESYFTIDLISPFYINQEVFTPRWRLGYIKNLNSKYKIGIDFGYGNKSISVISADDKYKLWEIRPELYYILNPERKTLKYFALELFYLNQNQKFTSETYLSETDGYLRYDSADYKRNKFGVIPKFGMFINISNRIGLNIYTGIGIKIRNNDYSNVLNAEEIIDFQEHISPYFREEGTQLGIEFSLGLKLYYRIKK